MSNKKNRNAAVRQSNVQELVKPVVNTESVNHSPEVTMSTKKPIVPPVVPTTEPAMNQTVPQEAKKADDVQKDAKEEGFFKKSWSYICNKTSAFYEGTKKLLKHGWDQVVATTTTRDGASKFISMLGDKSLQILMLALGMMAVTALAMKLGVIVALGFLFALYVAFKAISMLVSTDSFSTQLGLAPDVATISAAA